MLTSSLIFSSACLQILSAHNLSLFFVLTVEHELPPSFKCISRVLSFKSNASSILYTVVSSEV